GPGRDHRRTRTVRRHLRHHRARRAREPASHIGGAAHGRLTLILIAIFVLVYLSLGVIAWRRPLLARMAYREVVRRRWQSALVVAGLTVGTSMILMSLVNTASIGASLTRATYQ